jgi:hypothetical protein
MAVLQSFRGAISSASEIETASWTIPRAEKAIIAVTTTTPKTTTLKW